MPPTIVLPAIIKKGMKIIEIFKSLQGESSFTGDPCVFIRLAGCNLRCAWCDTKETWEEGRDMSLKDISQEVDRLTGRLLLPLPCRLVEITGGEPLLQEEVYSLIERLLDMDYKILVETNGSLGIRRLDKRIHIIMDIKCPSSGMSEKNKYDNIEFLGEKDEAKFVIGNREDYLWAKGIIEGYPLLRRCTVFFSPVNGMMDPKILAHWIMEDNLPVRLQIQLHKYLGIP